MVANAWALRLRTLRDGRQRGRRPVRPTRRWQQSRLEALEDRSMLAAFTVINTLDSGAGSLRQAIIDANDVLVNPGLDTINFNIPGGGVQTIPIVFDNFQILPIR
jgi:hypothetical protein